MFKKSSVCAKAAPHHSFIQQALCLPVRHLPMSHTLRFSTVDSASALRCALTAAKFQPCPTQTRILTFSKGSGSYWENVCVRRWSLFIRNESISEPQWEGRRGSAAFFWMKLLHGRPLPLLPASLAPSLDWSRLPVTDVRQTLVDEPARKNIHSVSSERFGELEDERCKRRQVRVWRNFGEDGNAELCLHGNRRYLNLLSSLTANSLTSAPSPVLDLTGEREKKISVTPSEDWLV